MKLSEWIKLQQREQERRISRKISHDSMIFGRGHNYALDKLLETLENEKIDLEIPFTKKWKY